MKDYEFKIGDKVRLTKNYVTRYIHVPQGAEGIIDDTAIAAPYVLLKGYRKWVHTGLLELVPPKEEVIEVGDYCMQSKDMCWASESQFCTITAIEGDHVYHQHEGNSGAHLGDMSTFKLIRKGGKKVYTNPTVTINAKKLLELGACEDAFKEFVGAYGKKDVSIIELYNSIGKKLAGRSIMFNSYSVSEDQEQKRYEGYQTWLKGKFPEAFVEEKTYKVGDLFHVVDDFGKSSICMVARSPEMREVILIELSPHRGVIFANGNKMVGDIHKITTQELSKLCGGREYELYRGSLEVGQIPFQEVVWI